MATTWRGVTLCDRAAAMMDEVARIAPGVPITATQGSYNNSVSASGGTHAGCGAIDLAGENLQQWQRDELVAQMRRVGWAAWHRTPAQSDWPHHIHGIAVNCPGLSPAAEDQVDDYLSGGNGLASSNGHDDNGPREHVGITWEAYLSEKDEQKRRDPDMILVSRPSDGSVHLVGVNGVARIYNPSALAEITHALQDPTHVAGVDEDTWRDLTAG